MTPGRPSGSTGGRPSVPSWLPTPRTSLGPSRVGVRRAPFRPTPTRPTPTRPTPTATDWGRALRISATRLAARTSPRRPLAVERVPAGIVRARTDKRLRLVAYGLATVFLLIAYQLADLQLLNPDRYQAVGAQQRLRVETLAADRGTIYDRNGIELALSVPRRSVFVDPGLVEDPPAEAARLAAVLGLDAAEIEAKMRGANRFAYVARHLDDDVATKVRQLDLPGVGLLDEPRRELPAGALASAVIGLTDIDGNGISGLEAAYGDDLTGTPGSLVLEQNPDGRTIAVGEHRLVPAVRGRDLQLTLDRSLQFETERILSEQVRDVAAKGGVAIVTRPRTGEIVAMANVVRDPDTGEVTPTADNMAVTRSFEPGSVMKMITAAGAIEEGKVTPDSELVVPDQLRICDATFSEHDFHGTVSWPVSKIISQSSNTGTIKMAQMLGRDGVYRYMRAFGLGEKTALDFPNEQTGLLPPPEKWWCSSMGTNPIGQSISVTPLQMLLAYNTIANGGVYQPARLVDAVVEPDGTRRHLPLADGRRVVSETTANQLNVVLRGVVDDGTGTNAAIPGYSVAGKTGTSRKPGPNGGYTDKYGVTQYIGTFVGFVPAENPEFSIIVVIDEPSREGIYGGVVAAPVFAEVGTEALRRYAVPPPASDLARGGTPVERPATLTAAGARAAGPSATGRVRALPAGTTPPMPPTGAGNSPPTTRAR